MDGRTHTTLSAHLRFVQYCVISDRPHSNTDQCSKTMDMRRQCAILFKLLTHAYRHRECYERKDAHPGIKVASGK